jgi:putative membrane protein
LSEGRNRSGKWIVVLALLAGLTGAIWLVLHLGLKSIIASVVAAGWKGFLLLCCYGAANFVLLGAGWCLVAPPYRWRDLGIFVWGRAVRDCAAEALPFSALGGMVIGARATMLGGIAPSAAFASTVVDVALEFFAQIVFVITGLIILAIQSPTAGTHTPLARMAIVAILLGSLAACALFALRRRGLTIIDRMAGHFIPAALTYTSAFKQVIEEIYKSPIRLFADFVVHWIGWLAAAFGTWLTLWLIGSPVSYLDAIAIESMLCAARSAMVFVPSSIGVQEAGYAMMMPLFGVPASVGLAVSVLKRSREWTLSIPVLISWQFAEAAAARRPPKPASDRPAARQEHRAPASDRR